jgi:LAGLIDADG endonuclease
MAVSNVVEWRERTAPVLAHSHGSNQNERMSFATANANLTKYFKPGSEFSVENLPDNDLAYIAGLFDGEGSIFIGKSKYGPDVNKTKNKSGFTFRVRCAVGMTDESIIHWLKAVTGIGRIYYKERPSTENSKPAWYWITNDRESIVFLRIIKDCLRVKKSLAELALELAWLKTFSRRGYRHMPEKQLEIVNKISELNHRGTAANKGGASSQFPT